MKRRADLNLCVQRYDPFGMIVVGRNWEVGSGYKYGFNGQEQDDEVYGNGNLNTAEFWEYDTRLGKRWNIDPVPTACQSGYATFNNSPILISDPNGDIVVIDDAVIGFFKGLFAKESNFESGSTSRLNNAFKSSGRHAANSAKIWGGLFTTDRDKNFLGKTWQLASRFTWELPNTLKGFSTSHLFNMVGNVKDVSYEAGATVVQMPNLFGSSYWGAFTLGSFIIGSEMVTPERTDPDFRHEYGHYLQSQIFGPAYWSVVAIPSFISATIDTYNGDVGHKHEGYWTETNATERGNNYFTDYLSRNVTYPPRTQASITKINAIIIQQIPINNSISIKPPSSIPIEIEYKPIIILPKPQYIKG